MTRLAALVLLLTGFATLVVGQNLTDSARARAELNAGVHAYKAGDYDGAVAHFRAATTLEPMLVNAHLYLATAYAMQVVPGVDTSDNKAVAQNAIAEFETVLKLNPDVAQKLLPLKGIASLYFNINDLDKSKEYQQKIIAADPNDPEAYYTIGVIDWTQAYKPRMEARAKLGLEPNEPMNNTALCSQIRAANEDKVKEGMDMLAKALELRPDYDDAMAYMNLMYRERADIQCGNTAAREADLKKADEWVNLTLATKKRKAEQQRTLEPPPPPKR